MSTEWAEWTGHMVVCGLDDVGLLTVEQLHRAGVPVVVVDDGADAGLLQLIRGWNIPVITGRSNRIDTLSAAGLAGAAAVICVLGDDLHTLETAVFVREERADVRIVVQLRNPAVGRALAAIGVAVLDVAGLSAPSVVEACLRTGTHELELGGERFVAAHVVTDAPGTLRSLYGDLAPLAVIRGHDREIVVCPGRDERVQAGDTATVLGTPDDLRAADLLPDRPQLTAPARRLFPRVRQLWWSLVDAADRRLLAVLALLGALTAVAVTVLRLGYREPDGTRMSVLDAVYFTVETIGTVGFGDFYFRDQQPWLRAFAISLMILGAISAAMFFALITNVLITVRIDEALGRGRLRRLSDHVVVIGLGAVGVRVVQQLLAADANLVVIDNNDDNRYLAQVHAAGVPVIVADATLPETLATAHLADASAVAILTSNDLVNLESGLAVRDQLGERWGEVPVVLRMFDRKLAATVQRSFGLGLVRSTAALAAPWFVGAALGLDVLATFYAEDQLLLVGGLTVADGGGLDGLAMQDLSARTRVVAISRAAGNGRLEHPPRRDTRFHSGDRAYLIGPYEELLQVLRRDALSPTQVATPAKPADGMSAPQIPAG